MNCYHLTVGYLFVEDSGIFYMKSFKLCRALLLILDFYIRCCIENTEGKKDTSNGVVLLDDDLMLTDESDDEHVNIIFIIFSNLS